VQNPEDEIATYTSAHDPSLGLMSNAGAAGANRRFSLESLKLNSVMEMQPGVDPGSIFV
jgi:hypothetical protein